MLVGGDGKEAVPVGESSKTAVPRTTSFALENGHCSGNGASGPPPAPAVRRESERAALHELRKGSLHSLSIPPSQSVVVGDAGGGPGLIPFFVNASTAASFTRHARLLNGLAMSGIPGRGSARLGSRNFERTLD